MQAMTNTGTAAQGNLLYDIFLAHTLRKIADNCSHMSLEDCFQRPGTF